MSRSPREAEVALMKASASQFGMFTRQQAIELGIGPATIRQRLTTGNWLRRAARVYQLAGVEPSHESQLMATIISQHSVAAAAGQTAAWLWKIDGVEPTFNEILIPAASRPRPREGFKIHSSRRLPTSDISSAHTIPRTTPVRTLLDLSRAVDAAQLEAACDSAVRNGLVSFARLQRQLTGAQRGSAGIAQLREIVAGRCGTRPGGSLWELKVDAILKGAGLPAAREYAVCDQLGQTVARVDFAYPRYKVAVEFDGYQWHAGRQPWEKDRTRANALEDLGWRIRRCVSSDVSMRPYRIITTVVRALEQAGAKL